MMKYFTISELCASATATRRHIDNTPPQTAIDNLTALVDNVLDPLRELYGKAIVVTSGYRCEKLNAAVGGAKNSQHMTGQAADIKGTPSSSKDEVRKLFNLIIENGLPFDQLINENNYSWVHVSYKSSGKNRGQILKL